MSLFANLKGDKRTDKDTLSDIRNLLGDKMFALREEEALSFGRVLYSALKLNGKIRAAKAWDKLKYEEKLKWGGIAVDVFLATEYVADALWEEDRYGCEQDEQDEQDNQTERAELSEEQKKAEEAGKAALSGLLKVLGGTNDEASA